jgi:hypothetical protein
VSYPAFFEDLDRLAERGAESVAGA